jgi:hypothetical protein
MRNEILLHEFLTSVLNELIVNFARESLYTHGNNILGHIPPPPPRDTLQSLKKRRIQIHVLFLGH